MSLSGNLGFVSLDEILRLLTRSKQEGSVNVALDGQRGRVFVGRGGIDLATTSDNDELHRHLVSSGYADERTLHRITTGETTLAAVAEDNLGLIDLLREITVESLYQIASRGNEFQVHEGASTPYASPKSFDLESLLVETDERKREWDRVQDVISDLGAPIGFTRDLGDRDEVAIKTDDWKVLSEIGAGSSVAEIADRLGTTEFWTARVAARLVSNDLIVLLGNSEGVDESYSAPEEPEAETEHAPPRNDYYSYEEPESDVLAVPEQDEPPAKDEDEVDVDPDESWWQEPEEEEDEALEEVDSETPAVVSEGLSEIPPVDRPKQDSEVEEDTEAFLEKVFSELDSSDAEGEEGHGLLRRRRMGTLRDFSSDS